MADAQVTDGLEIARTLKLVSLETRVESMLTDRDADVDVRVAAARTLGALEPAKHVDVLGSVISDPAAPDAVRGAAASALASLDTPAASQVMVKAMQTVPLKLQTALAQAMASGHGGAEALLDAIERGKASPRLLLDSNVNERLSVVKPTNYEQRIKKLTQNLPTAILTVQRLIDQRAAGYASSSASAQRGHAVFEKNCMVCHTLGGQGAHVGPPLDGIGVRGVPRLCEDILDPSRNVAAEFRQSTFVMTDGNVVAGIPRRTEGEDVVIADATGKEVTLHKSQITRQVESQLSLMPSNFGDVITVPDFNDLLSYLLTAKDTAVTPK
jgi:putative heme-binding domain-containing protein